MSFKKRNQNVILNYKEDPYRQIQKLTRVDDLNIDRIVVNDSLYVSGSTILSGTVISGTLEMSGTIIVSGAIDPTNYVQFNTSYTDGVQEARLQWNSDDGTLEVGMPGGNVNLQIGQEFLIRVKNDTGATISNGSLVYVTGSVGQRPQVALADKFCEDTSKIFAMVTEDIADSQLGYATMHGLVRDVDTSGCGNGVELFLSASGAFTATRPPAPEIIKHFGYCVYSHASEGIVYINGIINSTAYDSEPQGFLNRTDSMISFDDATRTFTIEPANGKFDIYWAGKEICLYGAQTVTLSNEDGIHYIYFDSTGSLTSSFGTTSTNFIINNIATAMINWNVNSGSAIFIGDERHGLRMDATTHLYLHDTRGAKFDILNGGLSLNGMSVDGDGSSNEHAQFGVAAGEIHDEDIEHSIAALTDPANISIFYLTGSLSEWRKKNKDNFPLIYNGTAGWSSTRPPYNQWTGTIWQLTEVPQSDYFLMHYFATNSSGSTDGVVGIQGQNSYGSVAAARDGAVTEINSLFTAGLPTVEFVALATVIFQARSTYGNTPKARIVSTDDGDDYVDWRYETTVPGGGVSVTEHGTLGGLTVGDDHPMYAYLNGRSGGQVLYGGSGSAEDLTLRSTKHDTSGSIFFGTNSVYDEANVKLAIGHTSPVGTVDIQASDPVLILSNSSGANQTNTGEIFFKEDDSAGFKVDYDGSANKLYFIGRNSSVDSTWMTIQRSDGYVGVGTTSPSGILEVSVGTTERAVYFSGTSSTSGQYEFTRIGGTTHNRTMTFTGNTINTTITSTEAVADMGIQTAAGAQLGVGIDSPSARLYVFSDVANSDNNHAMVILDGCNNGLDGGLLISSYLPRLVMNDRSSGYDWFDLRNSSDKFIIGRGKNTDLFSRVTDSIVIMSASGDVGIGINPSSKLDINGSNAAGATVRIRGGDGSSAPADSRQIDFSYNGGTSYAHSIRTRHNAGAGTGNAIDFYVWQQGVDVAGDIGTLQNLTLENGNVGIGTTSPGALLHLSASDPTILLTDGDTGADARITAASTVGGLLLEADLNNEVAGSYIGFNVDGVRGMTIDSDQDVGIGVTSPSSRLHVYDTQTSGAGSKEVARFVINTTGAQRGIALYGTDDNGSGNEIRVQGTNTSLHFVNNTGTKNVTIADGGNVGIGQYFSASAPAVNLHIKKTGDAAIWLQADVDNSGESDNPYIKFSQDGVIVSGTIGIAGDNNLDPSGATCTGVGENNMVLHHIFSTGKMHFATNAKVHMTIEASGETGVGTTTPDATFEVETTATEGHQAITIDQNDADQAFIDFQGTSAANAANSISTWTTGNSIQGFLRMEVNGSTYWIPYYNAPTS